MNFSFKFYLFAAALLIGSGLVYTLFIRQRINPDAVLRLGTMSGWPPYVSINPQGAYEGFDMDVAQEIARRLDKELTIADMDTAALITALDQNKVDFIMTGLSITKERQQKITMIPYQGKPITSYPLVFFKQIPTGVTSLEDLAARNAAVCVEAGSSQDSFLSRYENQLNIKRLVPSLAVLELVQGKCNALLLEEGLLVQFKKKYPELVSLDIPLDENSVVLGNGIGIKKTNSKLAAGIQQIIADLKKEGFIAKAEQKWFGSSQ